MGQTDRGSIRKLPIAIGQVETGKREVGTYDMLATVYFMSFNSPCKVGAIVFLSQIKKSRLSGVR